MALNYEIFVKGIGLVPNASTLNSARGDLEVLTSDGKLYYHNGSANVALVTESGTATLTNKTISGSTNTLSNITNASLSNSSVTVNGSLVSLGGSIVVTANTTNALTIGTGLSGTSFNGSAPVTITIDGTVATLTGTQALTNKTIDASLNTLSNITNTNLSGTAAISNANLAAMGANTVKANATGGSATPTDVGLVSTNTASTAVFRDASGNFSAGTITATLSGNATNVTGTVAIANGGTGQTTANAGFNALSPMTTGGDLIYGGASGVATRLANGASGQFLKSNGGTSAPSWTTGTNAPVIAAQITGAAATSTAGNPIIFPTVTNDTNSAYNNTTGEYTIPAAGWYSVSCAFRAASGLITNLFVYINGSQVTCIGYKSSVDGVAVSSGIFLLALNDVLTVRCVTNGQSAMAADSTYSIHKIS